MLLMTHTGFSWLIPALSGSFCTSHDSHCASSALPLTHTCLLCISHCSLVFHVSLLLFLSIVLSAIVLVCHCSLPLSFLPLSFYHCSLLLGLLEASWGFYRLLLTSIDPNRLNMEVMVYLGVFVMHKTRSTL